MKTKVYLIGGPPGAGKTTLGTALAIRLGITSLTIDDLVTATQAVTTSQSHPGLHIMKNVPYLQYFTESSVDDLIADAEGQHEAAWPLIEAVIRKHARWAPAIVIDGWHLRPEKVARLEFENIWSCWVIPSESVLVERENRNRQWLEGSSDQERMLQNFLARSLWFNTLLEKQATDLGMNILRQDGHRSVEELVRTIVELTD